MAGVNGKVRVPIPAELIGQIPANAILYSDGSVHDSRNAFLGTVRLENLSPPASPGAHASQAAVARLPPGVAPIQIPTELVGTLPRGSILGSDYNVYDVAGTFLGKVDMPKAPAGVAGLGLAPGTTIRLPPGVKLCPVPAGVELPPGCVYGTDGNVYDAASKVVGHITIPDQTSVAELDMELEAKQISLPSGCKLGEDGRSVIDTKSGAVIGHIQPKKGSKAAKHSKAKRSSVIPPPPPLDPVSASAAFFARMPMKPPPAGAPGAGLVMVQTPAQQLLTLLHVPVYHLGMSENDEAAAAGMGGVNEDKDGAIVVGTVLEKWKPIVVHDANARFSLAAAGAGAAASPASPKESGVPLTAGSPAAFAAALGMGDQKDRVWNVAVNQDKSDRPRPHFDLGHVSHLSGDSFAGGHSERGGDGGAGHSRGASSAAGLSPGMDHKHDLKGDEKGGNARPSMSPLGSPIGGGDPPHDPNSPLTFEPKEGLWSKDHHMDEYNKMRHAKPCTFIIPSRFSRPALAPDYPHDQKLTNLTAVAQALTATRDGSAKNAQHRLIWVANIQTAVNSRTLGRLGRLLSAFTNLTVLGLQRAGLDELENLVAPNLLRLDLSHNKFAKTKTVRIAVAECPNLQQLDLTANPICNTWTAYRLPPPKDSFWPEVIYPSRELEYLNGYLIPNAARAGAAWAEHQNRSLRKTVPAANFNHVMNQHPVVLAATKRGTAWDPLAIHTLSLANSGLLEFHVKCIAQSIVSLDLSGNELQSIAEIGLSHCDKLVNLNLSNNKLSISTKEYSLFYTIPHLQRLWLSGNPDLGKEYRHTVIYFTRNLPGNNRCGGLQELDGKRITLEERVASVVKEGSASMEDYERWNLLKVAAFGAHQLRNDEKYIQSVTRAAFPNCSLGWIDLTAFTGLVVVDLSHNKFVRDIVGLHALKAVRSLNLSYNPKLDSDYVMKELNRGSVATLEHVWLSGDPTRKVDRDWCITVLRTLGPKNHRLCVIEGKPIDVAVRVEVYRQTHPAATHADVDLYHMNLALYTCATPFDGRDYSVDRIPPGAVYKPEEVKHLTRLSGHGFVSSQFRVRGFVALERLNLAGNKLTDLLVLGLNECMKLRWLDVRNNEIKNPLSDIATLLNHLSELENVSLMGNPIMRNAKDRLALIGQIPRMHDVTCSLRVIDTPITLAERVESWKKQGASEAESEALRCRAALSMRAPKPSDMDGKDVLALNLDGVALHSVDLRPYPNLRTLRMKTNAVVDLSVASISPSFFDPTAWRALKVLDLRQNKLMSFPDAVRLVNAITTLEFIGLAENNFSRNYAEFRVNFLSAIPRLRVIPCVLKFLDDKEITGDEIADSWIAASSDKVTHSRPEAELFRFQKAYYDRYGHVQPNTLTGVDFSHSKLAIADFSRFTKATKLELDGNAFGDVDSLRLSGLFALSATLYDLSITFNKFKDMRALAEITNNLPRVRVLALQSCPAFETDSNDSRTAFLSLLDKLEKRNFPLKALNRRRVTLAERVDAVVLRAQTQAGLPKGSKITPASLERGERIRLLIMLEEANVSELATDLDLSNKRLLDASACSLYQHLRHLNLSGNLLTNLNRQGLDRLPYLQALDIRHNKIATLEQVTTALQGCDQLTYLLMEKSTADGNTTNVRDYLPVVTHRLRGVRTLDTRESMYNLTGAQSAISDWLMAFAGVGKNGLVRVNVANKNLPTSMFFYFLAALAELKLVEQLVSTGNQWSNGSLPNYRSYCIYALGDKLEKLDDVPISGQERLLARRAVKEEKRAVPLQKWTDCSEKADAALDEKKIRGKHVKRPPPKGVDFVDFEFKDAGATFAGALDAANAGANSDVVARAAETVKNVGKRAAEALTGSILNKVEIFANFLQIYGLVLVIPDIPWPQIFLDFSIFSDFFTLDWEKYFTLDVPYSSELKFAGVMLIPLFSLILYGILDRVTVDTKHRWEEQYTKSWTMIRCRAFMFWFLSLVLSFGIGFVCDLTASLDLMKAGQVPTSKTNGIAAFIGGFFTVVYFLWWYIVSSFRDQRLKDKSRDLVVFNEWWWGKLESIRKVVLFMLTVLFMPISRVILEQFYCVCDVDIGCHISNHESQACFPQEVSIVQIAAFIFGIIYIIGLPIFFAYLINAGVRDMIDVHGYTTIAENTDKSIKKLEAEKPADYKKQIAALKKALDKVYVEKATRNLCPQSYLYAGYERPYRYYKIFQMLQKLLIVAFTLYVPTGVWQHAKVVASNAVIIVFAATTIATRPFHDQMEDVMEACSQVANGFNVFSALNLNAGWIPVAIIVILLFAFNGVAIVVFIIGFCLAPAKYLQVAYGCCQKVGGVAAAQKVQAGAVKVGGQVAAGVEMARNEAKVAGDGLAAAGAAAQNAAGVAVDAGRDVANGVRGGAVFIADAAHDVKDAAEVAGDALAPAVDAISPLAAGVADVASPIAGAAYEAGGAAAEAGAAAAWDGAQAGGALLVEAGQAGAAAAADGAYAGAQLAANGAQAGAVLAADGVQAGAHAGAALAVDGAHAGAAYGAMGIQAIGDADYKAMGNAAANGIGNGAVAAAGAAANGLQNLPPLQPLALPDIKVNVNADDLRGVARASVAQIGAGAAAGYNALPVLPPLNGLPNLPPIGGAVDALAGAGGAAVQAGGAAAGQVADAAAPALHGAAAAVSPLAGQVQAVASPYANAAVDAASPYAAQAAGAVSPYAQAAANAASPYANAAVNAASPYANAAVNAASPYAQHAAGMVSPYAQNAMQAASPYANQLQPLLGAAYAGASPALQQLPGLAANGAHVAAAGLQQLPGASVNAYHAASPFAAQFAADAQVAGANAAQHVAAGAHAAAQYDYNAAAQLAAAQAQAGMQAGAQYGYAGAQQLAAGAQAGAAAGIPLAQQYAAAGAQNGALYGQRAAHEAAAGGAAGLDYARSGALQADAKSAYHHAAGVLAGSPNVGAGAQPDANDVMSRLGAQAQAAGQNAYQFGAAHANVQSLQAGAQVAAAGAQQASAAVNPYLSAAGHAVSPYAVQGMHAAQSGLNISANYAQDVAQAAAPHVQDAASVAAAAAGGIAASVPISALPPLSASGFQFVASHTSALSSSESLGAAMQAQNASAVLSGAANVSASQQNAAAAANGAQIAHAAYQAGSAGHISHQQAQQAQAAAQLAQNAYSAQRS